MSKKKISIITAIDENFAIGKDNKLLCHLPNDLQRFKKITLNHKIIMGRKTYDSLPNKPLAKRINIVLTKNRFIQIKGCIVVNSIKDALDYCQKDETFIIGGRSVYNTFLPFTNKLYLTKIHHTFQADTFLPEVDFKKWKIISKKTFKIDSKHLYSYSFLELIHKEI